MLSQWTYLVGHKLIKADIRLFTTMVRYNHLCHGLFRYKDYLQRWYDMTISIMASSSATTHISGTNHPITDVNLPSVTKILLINSAGSRACMTAKNIPLFDDRRWTNAEHIRACNILGRKCTAYFSTAYRRAAEGSPPPATQCQVSMGVENDEQKKI